MAETGTMTTSPPQSSASRSAIGELLLDALRLRIRLVDLVDRDDDRHLGRARVIDRFERLRHDAVIGATTRMTISVTLAPRARMRVNAS